jgi:hypothetical protein
LEAILDDYFSGRKRRAGYMYAKDLALEARQRQINDTWNELTQGAPGMDLTKLHVLQELIEAPYQKTVQIRSDDGVTSTHNVTVDGFDGRALTTRASNDDGSKATKETKGLSNVPVNRTSQYETAQVSREEKVIECLASNLQQSVKKTTRRDSAIDKENSITHVTTKRASVQ